MLGSDDEHFKVAVSALFFNKFMLLWKGRSKIEQPRATHQHHRKPPEPAVPLLPAPLGRIFEKCSQIPRFFSHGSPEK